MELSLFSAINISASISLHFSSGVNFKISVGKKQVRLYNWYSSFAAAVDPIFLYFFSTFFRMYYWLKLGPFDVTLVLISDISIYTNISIFVLL